MHRVFTELENFQQNCHYYKKGTILFSFFLISQIVFVWKKTQLGMQKKKKESHIFTIKT